MDELEAIFALYGVYLWLGLVALVIGLGLALAALSLRVARMTRQYQQLTADVDGANLEQALTRVMALLAQMAQQQEALGRGQKDLERTLQRAVQRVGVIRFNPFSDTGGDQSFSIALLDAHDDGVVVSSLFSRSETRVFAKPIQRGESSYTLTDEELHAIELANGAHVANRRG